MSGIVGCFDRTGGAVGPEDVTAMHDRIAHRGPDGGDTWRDDRAGLGHQLLATTPEAAHADQPVRDGDLVVVADARLDNRGELLATFPPRPSARPVTDAELLLEAYRRWGPDCVEHLVGAFAFAVWDAGEERLFCARDHVGVKPFYYHRSEDLFAFGSELKTILALPTVSRDVDETKIGDFLTGTFQDTANTYFESIRRLPPAHAVTVEADRCSRRRYWDLDPTRTIRLGSDAAYERRFRELFERAVRCRLRAEGPVSAALSGGLDSSSITVVARDLLPRSTPLHTFSNVYDEAPSSDEREFIETVVDREGIVSHYCVLDGTPALVDRDRASRYFDLPPHNSMHFARWEKAKAANDVGVDVMLCGALGDSAVNYGLGLLPELLRTGRWRLLLRELRAMGEIVGAPTHELFRRHALAPMIPEPVTRGYKRLRGKPTLEAAANPTLDATFVDEIALRSRYRTLTAAGSVLKRDARRWQRRSLTNGRVPATFETSDLANAAFGIEQRYPFTDVRLLEFSLAIPATQQLKDGWTRSIIRRALDDLLPEKIQWRPWKTWMNEAFWNALAAEDDRLRAIVADPGPLDAYLDADALEESYRRFTEDPAPRDARALWRALSLRDWLEGLDSGIRIDDDDVLRA